MYTIPFLGCVIWAMCLKRESSRRRNVNWAGILWSSSYLLVTVLLKWITIHKFEKALDDQDIQYSQISTRPAAFNTILWNANVDTKDAYLIADYSFFDSQPITFEKFPKNRSAEPVYESAVARKNLERLKDIAQGWYLMEQKNGIWYFYDLRFGQIPVSSTEQEFVFAYKLELQDHTLIATETEKNIDDASLIVNQLWERIQGN